MDTNLSKKVLKKHVAIVHCANELSVLERKISNGLLAHAYENLKSEETHTISIREVCNLINYHGNNYSVIKQAIKKLMSTVVEWNITNEQSGDEDWAASSCLSSALISSGRLSYSYSHLMRDLLSHPSMYAKINLLIQAKFKSTYGLALYENCIRYKTTGRTRWFTMDVFRRLMGVPVDKYPIYRDFKKRVISKAIEEVNRYSDIRIAVEYKKCGRAVTELQFIVAAAYTHELPGTVLDVSVSKDSTEVKIILSGVYGFDEDEIVSIFEGYSLDAITVAHDYITDLATFKTGQIKNIQGYFISALKYGYKRGESSSAVVNRTHKQSIRNEQKDRKLEKEQFKELSSFVNSSYQLLYAEYKSFDESIQSMIMGQFLIYLERTRNYIIQRMVELSGLDNPEAQKELARFLYRSGAVFDSDNPSVNLESIVELTE